MFRYFENLIQPTATPPAEAPPATLGAFYWYFVRQAKGLFLALVIVGFIVSILETLVPWFIGRLVTILTTTPRESLWADAWPTFTAMLFVILIARPAFNILQRLIVNQAVIPSFTTLVRWQSHWHVIRQSLRFFQDDFAGRISNRVMQAGAAVRETVSAAVRSVLHIVVFGLGSSGLMAAADWRLAMPMLAWSISYVALLAWMVPRQRERTRHASAMRSIVTGKVVDSYTNILTVKLFSRAKDEDAHVRSSMNELNDAFNAQQRFGTAFVAALMILNALLLAATGGLAILFWQQGSIEIGTVAMVLPLTAQIIAMSGWVAFEVQGIFENVGVVQESMQSIAVPLSMQDAPGAAPLAVSKGQVHFEKVHFGYNANQSVIDNFDLLIKPGEKVGLVGRSGAGKSTLVSLLLRFYEPGSGRILIDGQDIEDVTQESLRGAISVVTQDTSLLHRSIRENIVYGRPEATEDAVMDAARRAQALDFIHKLEDWNGRKGFAAHVGERGVKLSGGQRQRVAIARVILKDAPILVLDEATSALDSEVEAAIQDSFGELMQGKTVIAIAHRLSTLQIMDRLLVLDEGRIVEEGRHAELLDKGGLYASLWARQSGGFIGGVKKAKVSEAAE